MKLFWDLSFVDREHHYSVAETLIAGNVYSFFPAIRSVPLEWLPWEPSCPIRWIKVRSGEFIRWRVEGRLKDCLFLVQAAPRFPIVAQLEYMVPLIFPIGTIVMQI